MSEQRELRAALPVCASLRLLVPRPVSSGRQDGLEADAELFLKPSLPQMNQRLWKFCFVESSCTQAFSLEPSAPEEPIHPSLWGVPAPGRLIRRSF